MEREVKLAIFVVLIMGGVLLMGAFLQLRSPLTGFVTLEQSSLNSFDTSGAVFENTTHNGSAVVLEENKTEGSYISQIFDSGNENSTWNNLTFVGNNVSFQFRSCETESCVNESFIEGNVENIGLTSRYFQYKAIFSYEVNNTSQLNSVSLSYDIPEEQEFSITINSPESGKEYNSGEILLNVSSNEEVNTWEYSLNSENKTNFTSGETISNLSDGNYNLVVYANNSLEEINESVSFSILIPSCSNNLTLCGDESSCTENGGYWYDEKCNEEELVEETTEETTETTEESVEESTNETEETTEETTETVEVPQLVTSMEFSGTSNLEISPKENKQVVLTAKNTGDTSLSSCSISIEESIIADWISYSEDSFSLNKGKTKDIFLTFNIPEEATEGEHLISVSAECSQISKTHDININIIPVTFEFNLTEARKLRDNIRATYNIKDVSGEDQTINMKFLIFNNASLKISEMEEEINLSADEEKTFKTKVPINESYEGEMTIHIDINSQEYSSSVEESIILTSAPILGFVAIGDFITGSGGVITLILFIFIIISIIFLARRARKRRIAKKDKEKEKSGEKSEK